MFKIGVPSLLIVWCVLKKPVLAALCLVPMRFVTLIKQNLQAGKTRISLLSHLVFQFYFIYFLFFRLYSCESGIPLFYVNKLNIYVHSSSLFDKNQSIRTQIKFKICVGLGYLSSNNHVASKTVFIPVELVCQPFILFLN